MKFGATRSQIYDAQTTARARAAADAELTAAFQTTSEKAEREVARARKGHAAALEKELGELDAERAATQERLAKDFTAEQLANDRAGEERRKLVADRFHTA